MKKTHLFASLATAMLATAMSSTAQDLGQIELGVKYDLTSMASVTATFVAPESGILQVDGDPYLYYDANHSQAVDRTYVGSTSNGTMNQYPVEADSTYYLYTGFNLNSSYLLLEMVNAIEVTDHYPDLSEELSSAGYDYVDITFNQKVIVESATIAVGQTVVAVSPITASTNKTISIPYKDTFVTWYANGLLSGGETVTFTLTGITNSEGQLFGSNGVYSVQYTAATRPLQLVAEQVPAIFYSYFSPGDEAAILKLTFDGDLSTAEPIKLTFGYGDMEGGEGAYYTETMYSTAEGASVTFDFSGKLRTPDNMTSTGTLQEYVSIKVGPIYAADGSLVYSPGQGTMGTFGFAPAYSLLEYIDVACQFYPSNGSELAGYDQLEIWVRGVEGLVYDGVKITGEKADGSDLDIFMELAELTITPEDDDEVTILVPLTDEITSGKNIKVSLNIIGSTDGYDHSGDVVARYNGFVVTYCDPADGSSIASLKAGDRITIRTNKGRTNPDLRVSYSILNTDNDEVMVSGDMTRDDDASYYVDLEEALTFYSRIAYDITFTAYEDATTTEPLGSETFSWTGTTATVSLSVFVLDSVDPADGTTLATADQRVFTFKYDGVVELVVASAIAGAVESLVADDDDAEGGYSTQWTLTLSKAYMESIADQLVITLRAYDQLGQLVEGNVTTYSDSFLELHYPLAYNAAITTIEADAASHFTVYNLQGIKVMETADKSALEGLRKGIYVVNGRKVMVR
ncbi:MAG: hypothetical protein LIO90_10690 [Bacteroidales bacterium]|nr:hypothetical protein [Bacteroidales bacterium]